MINNFELILTPDAMKIQRVIIQKIFDGDFEFVQKMNQNLSKVTIPDIILCSQKVKSF